MEYGKIITREVDKDGNYHEVEKNIVEGIINPPISYTIEERVKVHNIDEEIEEYRKFSEQIKDDTSIINPAFKIATSRTGKREGYYFVIKCYTKLERYEKS